MFLGDGDKQLRSRGRVGKGNEQGISGRDNERSRPLAHFY